MRISLLKKHLRGAFSIMNCETDVTLIMSNHLFIKLEVEIENFIRVTNLQKLILCVFFLILESDSRNRM